jgi:hypothetical protein
MDKLKRTSAKRARRDTRRRKAQRRRHTAHEQPPANNPLVDVARVALDSGRPKDLLHFASVMIDLSDPERSIWHRQDLGDLPTLDELVTAFIETEAPASTAVLAVLSELSTNDGALKRRCRRELAKRRGTLPVWLSGLGQTTVHRALRREHVLGDGAEFLLAVRLADGLEMTCAVYVDHLALSSVTDVLVVSESLDAVLGRLGINNEDSDATFVELGLAEARVILEKAVDAPLSRFPLGDSNAWPDWRAVVGWLVQRMPDGGVLVSQPDSTAVLERFFASWAGVPFTGWDYDTLLERFVDEGTGDPLRWSAERLRLVLRRPDYDEDLQLDVQLDGPELLRAYVPFAHAESGIRHELTADAVKTIDELAECYREAMLDGAREAGYFDDDEGVAGS